MQLTAAEGGRSRPETQESGEQKIAETTRQRNGRRVRDTQPPGGRDDAE